ncbi:MAG: geranylgeranylglycerol-phosphate geranylgeranyltransferase [Candidatus Bathyarchaeia archaeon]
MKKLVGFVRLIRPVNCLMMGFAVMAGAFIVKVEAQSLFDIILKFLLGFLTAFTLTGASMVINDYWDREIDRINEPDRPIPSGLVSPRESLLLAAVLTSMGLSAALRTSPSCTIIAILSWIVSLTYSTKGKRTGLLGNFLVSICISIPFVYGSFLFGERLEPAALIFAMLAFLSNTGREVTKGIVDVQGDMAQNIRTIAVSYGEKAGAYVASFFYVSASGLSLLPIHLNLVSFWFLPFVLLADAGFIGSSFLLIRDYSRENARRVKNLSLIWMMFGLLAFIAGAVLG